MVNIYKFCKNFDPTTWKTSRTTSSWRSTKKKFELHKISLKTNWLEGSIYINALWGQLHLASKFQNISIGNFKTSWKFLFFFFSKVQNVKYLPHLLSNPRISVNLPMVNIYKFCKREILIQPPGESREQHLGNVRPQKFKMHKIS